MIILRNDIKKFNLARAHYRENTNTSHSGAEHNESVEKEYVPPLEVVLQLEPQNILQKIYDTDDVQTNKKPPSSVLKNFNNIEQDDRPEREQVAYVGRLGESVNISCLTPGEHFWCISTSRFAKSSSWLDDTSCFTSTVNTVSSSVQVLHYSGLADVRSSLHLEEDMAKRNLTASTLIFKNLSTSDVGSYECFTFNSLDGSEDNLEVIYQTLYLYVNGGIGNLSVPTDHIYSKKTRNNSDEIYQIDAKLGENIIIPCRPTYPEVIVDIFKQDPRPKERILDPTIYSIYNIIPIKSKGSSSQFYQHHLTPLFYYHPRIGFVLNNASILDKGLYHCRFTSSYKYEAIKSFQVVFTDIKIAIKNILNETIRNFNNASHDTTTISGSLLQSRLDCFPHMVFSFIHLVFLARYICKFDV